MRSYAVVAVALVCVVVAAFAMPASEYKEKPIMLILGLPQLFMLNGSTTDVSMFEISLINAPSNSQGSTVLGFSWQTSSLSQFTPLQFTAMNVANGYTVSWSSYYSASQRWMAEPLSEPLEFLQGPWLLNITCGGMAVHGSVTAFVEDWSTLEVPINGTITTHLRETPSSAVVATLYFEVPFYVEFACPMLRVVFNGDTTGVQLALSPASESPNAQPLWIVGSTSQDLYFTMPCTPVLGNNAGLFVGSLSITGTNQSSIGAGNFSVSLLDTGSWLSNHNLTDGKSRPLHSVVTETYVVNLPTKFVAAAAVVTAVAGQPCTVYAALDAIPATTSPQQCSGLHNQAAISVASPGDGLHHRMYIVVSGGTPGYSYNGANSVWGSIVAVVA